MRPRCPAGSPPPTRRKAESGERHQGPAARAARRRGAPGEGIRRRGRPPSHGARGPPRRHRPGRMVPRAHAPNRGHRPRLRPGPRSPSDEPHTGLLSTIGRKTAEAVGRHPEPALLLLRDLRDLHLAASGNSLYWEMLAQAGQATKDEALLDVATRCHPQTLRQMRWTNTMIKTLSPQALASLRRPLPDGGVNGAGRRNSRMDRRGRPRRAGRCQ